MPTVERRVVCIYILVLQMPTVERRSYSIKYEHFVQVSSNQKHIFIMFADVRCGQVSISKQPWYILPAVMVVLPAVTHAFRRVRK